MKLCLKIFIVIFFFGNFNKNGFAQNPPSIKSQTEISASCRGLFNTDFIENKGQVSTENGEFVSAVLMYCRKRNFQIFITENGFSYVFHQQKNKTDSIVKVDENFQNGKIKRENIDWIELKNKSSLNFYNQNIKEGIAGLQEYSKVRIRNVYDGIDLILEVSDTAFKYSFEVAANIDEKQIQIKFSGIDALQINPNNELKLNTRFGNLIEKNVTSWQTDGYLTTQFVQNENKILSYKISDRNNLMPLTIDPTLVWLTFLGDDNADIAMAVDADKFGNYFVTGYSSSIFFPTQNVAGAYFQNTMAGYYDVFISKFSSNLQLIWSTFYGGSNGDIANAIKTDNAGNIFVAGSTFSPDFPRLQGTSNYSQTVLNTNSTNAAADAFLLKFDKTGVRKFAVFFGGTTNDFAHDIAINNVGDVYVVGKTASANFPTQNAGGFFQNGLNGLQDGFITQFSNSGVFLSSSYFGGNGKDDIQSISIDNSNNFFLAGSASTASQFPLLNNGGFFQNTSNGIEAFASKFNNNNTMQWSTLYGGASDDVATSTAIDNLGNFFVAGNTNSSNFPVFKNNSTFYFDSILNNGQGNNNDVFLLKFSNNGNRLWSTLLGGSNADFVGALYHYYSYFDDYINDALIADDCGNIYFSFQTFSTDVPLMNAGCNDFFDNNLTGNADALITKFSKQGELKWSTYLGGTGEETGLAMALDNKSNLLCANNTNNYNGYTLQVNNPGAFVQPIFSNNAQTGDIVLTKFEQPNFAASVSYSNCSIGCSATAQATVTPSCNHSAFSYLWSNGASGVLVNNFCTGNNFVIVTDTLFSCTSDTIRFNLHHGIQIAPQYTPFICSHLCNGTASIQVPGISNIKATWRLGDTIIYHSTTVSNLCLGNDTLIVNAPGCAADTAIFQIQPYPFIKIFLNNFNPRNLIPCPYPCNGFVQVILQGGQKNPTCIWSNGTKGTTDSTLCAGSTYTVIASDSVCYTSIYQVTMPPVLVRRDSIIILQAQSCFPTNSAKVLTYNFGTPIHYLWSNGDITAVADSLGLGTYTCIVSDSCFKDTLTVIVPSPLPKKNLKIILKQIKFACNKNVCNAMVQDSIIVAGYSPYTYYWEVKNRNIFSIGKNDTLGNLCYGDTVLLMVKDICGDSAFAQIVVDTGLFRIVVTPNTTDCAVKCNSTAKVNPINQPKYIGVPPYTYYWSNGTVGLNDSNLCPNKTYYVIGYDGCGRRDSVSFVVPRKTMSVYVQAIAKCFGACGGNALAIGYAGIPPYHYYWSNGQQNTAQATGLCNNQYYNCWAVDTCGDTAQITFKINQPLKPSVVFSTSPSCPNFCNGTISAVPMNGSPPYSYLWNTGATTATITNACSNILYSCTVKDSCGGSWSGSVKTQPVTALNVNISTSPSCGNSCTGSISFYVSSGGIPPYSYLWNTGATGSTLQNACADTIYTCIISDRCGDTIIRTAKTRKTSALSLTCTSSPSNCGLCNGAVYANLLGGQNPYKYFWSNGKTTSSFYNACADTIYRCIATDFCGDTLSGQTAPTKIKTTFKSTISTTPSCINVCTGTATISCVGNSPPYSYKWNNGTIGNQLTNACANTVYKCTIFSACGDSFSVSTSIAKQSPISNSVVLNNTNCNINCSANALVNTIGGVIPYQYLWSTGSTQSQTNGLCADSIYTCIVSSVCGSDTLQIHIPNFVSTPLILSVSTDTICGNVCNGKALATASGGTLPYAYKWSNGSTNPVQNNLCANNYYQCRVTDACLQTQATNFLFPAVSIMQPTLQFLKPPCDNGCHNVATINVAGGLSPISFLWKDGSRNSVDSNLCPEKNYCIIKDGCNNKDSFDFYIHRNLLLQNFVTTQLPSCIVNCSGSATLSTVGGLSPYRYRWANGDTMNFSKNLCVGNTFCIVKDACNQADTQNVFIQNKNLLKINTIATTPTCSNICIGSIALSVSGGDSLYRYLWNTGDTTAIIHSVCTGIYSVIITNPTCLSDTILDTFNLASSLITSSNVIANVQCNGDCNGVAITHPKGSNPPFNIVWNNNTAQKDSINNNLCSGISTLKITDSIGCIITDTLQIAQPTPLNVDTNNIPSHCNNSDGMLVAQASGGTKPYAYVWSNGIKIDSNKNIPSGNYGVIVTDSNGCQLSKNFTLTVLNAHVYVSHDTILHLGDSVKLFAYGAKKYFWQPAIALACDTCQQTIWKGIAKQSYCVIGIDRWNCADTACVTVDLFSICGDFAAIKMPNAFSPNNDGIDETYKPIVELPDCFSEILFRIYNRWGEQLFQATDFNIGWDGTFNGKQEPIETYVWYLKVKNYLGEEKMMKGDVILVR